MEAGKLNTVAIIQARMGSTRLPGKVLRTLAGKPVLWHIIYRLRKCQRVDAICIATSDKQIDDPIEEYARQLDVACIRGSEDNVLERYVKAAQQSKADLIVRITGDVPLIDPETIDCMIQELTEKHGDYCLAPSDVPCIHEGIDPFSREILDKLAREKGQDPVAREHVAGYFKQHPNYGKAVQVQIASEFQFAGARLSVDTPADLRFLERLYSELDAAAGDLLLRDVVVLLKEKPELLRINSYVYQKSATERTAKVLFRCDGGERVGLGHVVRCLALADELRDRHGLGVTFAMQEDSVGFAIVRAAGYAVIEKDISNPANEAEWLSAVIEDLRPDVLVMDFRTDMKREHVEQWRAAGLLIVTIDDPSERRLAADLAFYPPVPQVREMDWSGFTGELFHGWEWVLLRRQFAEAREKQSALSGHRSPSTAHQPDQTQVAASGKPPAYGTYGVATANWSTIDCQPRILVVMGGSDPMGLTLKSIAVLDEMEEPFSTIVVLGRAFAHEKELESLLADMRKRYDVKRDVQNMAELMATVDIAISSFCVTAYELAFMCIPGIYLSLTEDHAVAASVFEKEGIGVSLGVYSAVDAGRFTRAVEALLRDASRRAAMVDRMKLLADGDGCASIALRIKERLACLPRKRPT